MLYQFCSRFGLVSLPEVFQRVQPLRLDALGQLGKLCPIAAHGVLVPDCGTQHSQQEQHQQPTASVVLSAGVFRFGSIRSRLRGRTVLGRFAGGKKARPLRLRVITGGTASSEPTTRRAACARARASRTASGSSALKRARARFSI